MHLLWVSSMLFGFVAQTKAVPSSVHVTTDSSVVDQEACYVALQEAMQQTDHHRNNMTLEEYLQFAIAYRPDADGFFVEDEDTVVGDQQQQGDISNSTAAVKELLFDVQFLLVVHYYSPFYNYNRAADNDDRGVGSNNTADSETTRSLIGDTTPTVSEQSYLFQVCTTTPTSNSSTLHNQNTDALQSSTTTTTAPISSTVATTTVVPEESVSAPSTTSTAVPTAAAANGTTLVVPPPPTSMNREEQQGPSTTNDNNNNSTTTTTIITEEEDRRVASIVGPVVVVVIIAVMIIAYYVTRRRSKNDEEEEENDAAVAVLLLEPPQVAAAAVVAHNTTTSDNDEDDADDLEEEKNVVVIVDTAIKLTDVSNDNVMTNQLSLKLVPQEGGGIGGTGTEHYSWSSSCPSVMSSSGWSSSAGVDSP
eukprot:CAMPEP_0170778558 /NCGR_PEP_ID=MMETSP0733-20121128/12465_1 /TAXON_ID=186038 /ORGANISM="Fragilariopsis kerguelensis, Strain L26-C5" /LENGTH=419 /DNA_ID=CAMNT_0011122009 /DNA_START=194 /DNA_END=1453 /DNA_ORIENTATION=+